MLSLCGAAAHFFSVRGIWEGMLIPLGILRTIVHPPSFLCLFQNVCKPAEETRRPPTLQEIKQKIASYNSREKNCLGMKLVSGLPTPSSPQPPTPTSHHPMPTPPPPPAPHPLPVWLLRCPSGFWGYPLEVPFLWASGGIRGCRRRIAWAVRASCALGKQNGL